MDLSEDLVELVEKVFAAYERRLGLPDGADGDAA
jgi:hypothetical protein